MDENKSSKQSPLAGIALFTAVMVVAIVIGASWSETVQAESEKESASVFLKNISVDVMVKLKKENNDGNTQSNDLDRVYRIIYKNILPHLDCITMTKMALGGHWALIKESRKDHVSEFMKMLMGTYGSALNEYNNQDIKFFPAKLSEDNRIASVKAEIERPDSLSIPMAYRLRLKDNAWKIYDIKIDGISLVTSFRGTFAQVVMRSGDDPDHDPVLKYMRDKNSKLPANEKLDTENHFDICFL